MGIEDWELNPILNPHSPFPYPKWQKWRVTTLLFVAKGIYKNKLYKTIWKKKRKSLLLNG